MSVRVSIIIPAYNRADVIGETLASVIAQTEKSFECLVVDDASTDSTAEVVKEFAAQNTRIRLITSVKNKGACHCRNQGLALAQGEKVCFLDSDDVLDARYLSVQCAALDSAPDEGVAICQTLRFQGQIENTVGVYGDLASPISLARYLCRQVSWSTSSALWRTSVIKALGGFHQHLSMHQDWAVNACYLAGGGTVLVTPDALVYYRDQWGDDQITARKKNDSLRVLSLYQSRKLVFDCALKQNSLDSATRSALAPHFSHLSAQLIKHGYYWKTLDGLLKAIYLTRHWRPLKTFAIATLDQSSK